MKKLPIITLFVLIALALGSFALYVPRKTITKIQTNPLPLSANINIQTKPNNALIEPVSGFKGRITKKYFGIYITPETSPIEHDRFTGFHTGVDAEFTDVSAEVPVYAIADGTVVVRKWVSGYGGVIVLRHILNDKPVFVIYGHLDPESFGQDKEIKAGQIIAKLGDDHSHETDGVRKHLHFAIYTGENLDIRGYVMKQNELIQWLNPLDLY